MGSWVPAVEEAVGVSGGSVALLASFSLPCGAGEEELGLTVLRVMSMMGAQGVPLLPHSLGCLRAALSSS